MSLGRILVIDDEPQIQRFLRPALEAAGYESVSATTAREGRQLLLARAPDLVILDLGLPDADGKNVIADIRGFSAVPIIVLSARDRESEKVEALDRGADDYVEKPFGISELLARIRSVLRNRGVSETDARMTIGDLIVDSATREVSRAGTPVHLTPKEFDLLLQLVRHAGKVMTHRQLLGAVWGQAHLDDVAYLRVTIGQLRAKLEADPAQPRLILNEPAVGYRLATG